MIRTDYATELAKQLPCDPSAANQCINRAAAAPGCSCRVFIQPTDLFATENLSNMANAWFDADCTNPTCPATCTTATTGTCKADSTSPKGGKCI